MKMSVKYDYKKREIHVYVRIRKVKGQSKPRISTPPVAIPSGEWKVCWELDEKSVKYARFNAPGVTKHSAGDLPFLELACQCEDIKPHLCPASVKNTTVKPEDAALGALDLFFQGNDNGEVFPHDPTIAVTLDPVGGHRKPRHAPRAAPVLAVKA